MARKKDFITASVLDGTAENSYVKVVLDNLVTDEAFPSCIEELQDGHIHTKSNDFFICADWRSHGYKNPTLIQKKPKLKDPYERYNFARNGRFPFSPTQEVKGEHIFRLGQYWLNGDIGHFFRLCSFEKDGKKLVGVISSLYPDALFILQKNNRAVDFIDEKITGLTCTIKSALWAFYDGRLYAECKKNGLDYLAEKIKNGQNLVLVNAYSPYSGLHWTLPDVEGKTPFYASFFNEGASEKVFDGDETMRKHYDATCFARLQI